MSAVGEILPVPDRFLSPVLGGRPLLALDLELSPRTGELLCAGWVLDLDGQTRAGQVGAADLSRLLELLRELAVAGGVLVGHNIRRFDLPHLWQLAQGQPQSEANAEAHTRWPELWRGSVLDTLELSALVWPGRPTHRLDKLYRQQTQLNDPIADCREALSLLWKASTAPLPGPLLHWLTELLPTGPLTELLLETNSKVSDQRVGRVPGYAEAAAELAEALGLAAGQRLWAELGRLPPAQPDNLGALVALHWLLRRHEPVHRRPAWAASQWPSFAAAEAAALGEPDYSEQALRDELREIYGPDYDFRPGQLELVQAVLKGENIPLGLLPTGGGKSLTFQFPALLLSRRERALTVVLSPLTALMEDQVLSLQTQLPAYAERAAYLSGTQSPADQRAVLDSVWEGRTDLLYLSPERLRNPGVQRLLRHRRPALWVLDEAHTLSQWGIDFRPDFLRVAGHIAAVHEGSAEAPRVALLTATATARVLDDLQAHLVQPLAPLLGERPLTLLPREQSSPWRSNIETRIEQKPLDERLPAARAELLAQAGEGRVSIVYVRSRRRAEEYAAQLAEGGRLRTAAFHARIRPEAKREVLRQFKAGELDVVVATSAFGMGIDRPGIHTVIHMEPPNTAESYLQEIGRVARKAGERGRAVLYWDESDFASALRQDAAVRIGRDGLRKCWDKARACLARPVAARWMSSQEFEGPLGLSQPEDLLTQTRVALRALEAFGLLYEGHNQPAELLLRLRTEALQTPRPAPEALEQPVLGPEGTRLLSWLRRQGTRQQSGAVPQGNWQEIRLDVMETSLLASLSPQGVLQAARQLVAAELAEWSYRVTVRFRPRRRTRLEQVRLSLRALLAQWREQGVTPADLASLDAEAVQADLQTRNKQASFDLARLGLRVLGLAHARKAAPRWAIVPLESAPPLADWEAYAAARLTELEQVWTMLVSQRSEDDVLTLDMAELDRLGGLLELTPGVAAASFGPLESLLALEGLGMVDVARGDEAAAHIFRLERGQRSRYDRVAFSPLHSHYADRTRRIHVMRLLVQQPSEQARQHFIEDYFALPLDEFCARYAPGDPDELTVAQLPGTRERILGGLNEVQRRVVEDSESRALLVLAGPGSGKTRTIVHRAAALLALEHVPPEQVLILAYNRTAVAEVRSRVGALLGPLGLSLRPKVLTFHGLARELTGLRATDARDAADQPLRDPDAANHWLLAQLIAHLQEHDVTFRYVLVDEYQDIDDQKYDIVRLLARFTPQVAGQEAEQETAEEGTEDTDEAEQESYLVAVGDDDQNIYGFQGANIRYIGQFRRDYQIRPAQELCLTDNYRSAPELVAFSNAFIASALPQAERLKGPSQAIVSRVEGSGTVGFCRYDCSTDAAAYAAAHTVARKVEQLHASGTPLHEIAVLAPQWQALYAVQHALRERGLDTQYFNSSDDLRPSQTLLGRWLIGQLEDSPATLCADPAAELLRLCEPYSSSDSSFAAMRAAVDDLRGVTFEVMAMRLRGAKPLRRGAVALSSFHSAKGSEFEQVLVLDHDRNHRDADPVRRQDAARALYVALTRARRGLFVLSALQQGHPGFTDEWLYGTLGLENVPQLSTLRSTPPSIRYTLELEPRNLYLSAREVVSQRGRQQIDAYARTWGNLTRQGRRILAGGQVVAVLSGIQAQALAQLEQRGGQVRTVQAMQVFYCERDDEWYERAGYSGPEQGHYLVLPRLECEEALQG